jgi:hypothetical protein
MKRTAVATNAKRDATTHSETSVASRCFSVCKGILTVTESKGNEKGNKTQTILITIYDKYKQKY